MLKDSTGLSSEAVQMNKGGCKVTTRGQTAWGFEAAQKDKQGH